MNSLWYRIDSLRDRCTPDTFGRMIEIEIETYINERSQQLKEEIKETIDIIRRVKLPPRRII